MSVYMKIDNCANCPFRMNVSRSGELVNVPICMKTGLDLPYEVTINPASRFGFGGMEVAEPTNEIPNWCPLQREPE